MSFYAEPSFYVLVAIVVAIAAVLGLHERSLQRYGLVVSVIFIFMLFCKTFTQGLMLLIFLGIAIAAERWLLAKPDSNQRYAAALLATIAPLVAYKIGAVWNQSILGFLGISYITFKAAQVVIETRDGLITKMPLADHLYFLLFFPTFTSGPIDRSRRFLQDAHTVPSRDEYAGMLARGILLLLLGMVYKFVLAGYIHRFLSFGVLTAMTPEAVGKQVLTAWQYALYLFFDFAGYSFMAMGVGYALGIRVPRNFRAPFAAVDIIDFWDRWHITLSHWLRDFVFMRLTGHLIKHRLFKGKDWRLHTAQLGLMCNMLLMGAWHGLTVDYLCYGLFHGVLLALCQRMHMKSKFFKHHKNDLWFRGLSWFVTINLVVLSFALFSGQVSTVLGGLIHG